MDSTIVNFAAAAVLVIVAAILIETPVLGALVAATFGLRRH